jgi:hypothetical protein
MLIFPYLSGMAFFETLGGRTRLHPNGQIPPHARDTASWHWEVFQDPPESTEQILHPEKYLNRELPVELKSPAMEEANDVTRNVLGEFGIRLLLEPTVGPVRAYAAAAGWGGDRIALTQNNATDQRAIRWLTCWDTPLDADEFAEALADALAARYTGKLEWVRQADDYLWKNNQANLLIERIGTQGVDLTGTFGPGSTSVP